MPRTKHTVKAAKAEDGKSPQEPISVDSPPTNQSPKAPLVLFERPRRMIGPGQGMRCNMDLSRFVRWPRYVRMQRQRNVLLQRMKIPPVINQFSKTLDKSVATTLFRLLHSHRPETAEQRKQRLIDAVVNKKDQLDSKMPNVVKHGIRHVAHLVEQKKAKLVVIANDVSPIELVLWLPTLCKKKGIPYVIVKDKARLGIVVGKKTATALAFVNINPVDKADFANLVEIAQERYNDAYSATMRTSGGLVLSNKARETLSKRLVKA